MPRASRVPKAEITVSWIGVFYSAAMSRSSAIIGCRIFRVSMTGSDKVYIYKDLFASLCFIFFGAALAFNDPYLYFAAMMCACLSTTAHRKKWPDPPWATLMMEDIKVKFRSIKRRYVPQKEFKNEEEIETLPPLDDR